MEKKITKEDVKSRLEHEGVKLRDLKGKMETTEDLENAGKEEIEKLNKVLAKWEEKIEEAKKRLSNLDSSEEEEKEINEVLEITKSLRLFKDEAKQNIENLSKFEVKKENNGEKKEKNGFDYLEERIDQDVDSLFKKYERYDKSEINKKKERLNVLKNSTAEEIKARNEKNKNIAHNSHNQQILYTEGAIEKLGQKMHEAISGNFEIADIIRYWNLINLQKNDFPKKDILIQKLKSTYERIKKDSPEVLTRGERNSLELLNAGKVDKYYDTYDEYKHQPELLKLYLDRNDTKN